jgi:hypothetical protein
VTRLRLARIFWIGAAAILVAAALVALTAVLRGDFSETDGRILLTLAAILYSGGAALAGLALVDRGPARALGMATAAAAPVCLALVSWGIWSFAFDGGDSRDATRAAWSAVLVLLAGLVATTGLLLVRLRTPLVLAALAGGLAALAAGLSVGGIWAEPSGDGLIRAIAVCWILAALAFFLAPVLQRFAATGENAAPRVLGELNGVELVASRAPVAGGVPIVPPARGERLSLRRRSALSADDARSDVVGDEPQPPV